MARSPLFDWVQSMLFRSYASLDPNGPPVDEIADGLDVSGGHTRRNILKLTAGTVGLAGVAGAAGYGVTRYLGVSTGSSATFSLKNQPKVAIVGAGLAGLTAAYYLKKNHGIDATVYEAGNRVGGRVFSQKDLLGKGVNTELGGEFINSSHKDMLVLIKELGLPLLDKKKILSPKLQSVSLVLGGQKRTHKEFIEAFQPLAKLLAKDHQRMKANEEAVAKELDQLSFLDYTKKVKLDSWVQGLLSSLAASEMGLDAHEQTALSLVYLWPKEKNGQFQFSGESDERFKVEGGNQRIPNEIAKRLGARVVTGKKLEAIKQVGSRYKLSLQGKELLADAVIVTVPFSILRSIPMGLALPPTFSRFVNDVGYGTNAKILAGTTQKLWRQQNLAGEFMSDTGFQVAWDNTMLQSVTTGGITFFSGGKAGLDMGKGNPSDHAKTGMAQLQKHVVGVQQALNGKVARYHWPSAPMALGGYACFKPRQYTEFVNKHVYTEKDGEKSNVVSFGNVWFAGEHLSDDYQGYMNGGAQTGRMAAMSLIKKLMKKP